MEIVERRGDGHLAEIYVARLRDDPLSVVEFVDAVDPRFPREEKWVITVSTQIGCPIRCRICDAGGFYRGNLTADEILAQIGRVVQGRQGDRRAIRTPKLKIHFARMGEPALNPAVLQALERLPGTYDAPGLIPCIPTVAPAAAAGWFDDLLAIKRRWYARGRFQLQFSINSTDPRERDVLMPVEKWGLREIAAYGRRFHDDGDRKVVLNFALAEGVEADPDVIARCFDPDRFLVKLTPVNPTETAVRSGYGSVLSASAPDAAAGLVEALEGRGFDCIVSIGDDREITLGSNCGQAASVVLKREAIRRAARAEAGGSRACLDRH